MTIFGLWVFLSLPPSLPQPDQPYAQVINKAGGLVYQRNFGGRLSFRNPDVNLTPCLQMVYLN